MYAGVSAGVLAHIMVSNTWSAHKISHHCQAVPAHSQDIHSQAIVSLSGRGRSVCMQWAASSSLPPPILPVLRAHLSDVSVATTELDVTSLPELTEDDRAGDDGLDLLLGPGADGRMNGVVMAVTTI